MIKTLRESKAKRSELVEMASRGEDVLITVDGQVKARLTKAGEFNNADRRMWAKRLERFQKKWTRPGALVRTEDFLRELREDRF